MYLMTSLNGPEPVMGQQKRSRPANDEVYERIMFAYLYPASLL